MSLKIMMVSEHASPLARPGSVDSGGQNIYVGNLARAMARLGHKVDIFTRRSSEEEEETVQWKDGVRVINVPAGPARYVPKEKLLPFMESFSEYCCDFAEKEKYDLGHANFWMSGIVSANVKKRTGLPFGITFHALGRVRKLHQGKADGFPLERGAIEEQIAREADFVVAECPQDKEDLVSLYGVSSNNLYIAPCGVDTDTFYPVKKTLARLLLGIREDTRVVLQLGRLVPRKGVDDVIRAIGLLAKDPTNRNIHLLVVGGGTFTPAPQQCAETKRLMELSDSLGVSNQVTFIGRRNPHSLRLFYSAADLFVTVPWYEPFGITPLEAMACGTPVVGAAVGGIKYSVQHGKTGVLVPPKDPLALARTVEMLLNRPHLREKLSHYGRERILRMFTWQKVAERMIEIYYDALSIGPERFYGGISRAA